MMAPVSVFRLRSAASAYRHPPIGFRGVMIIEPGTEE